MKARIIYFAALALTICSCTKSNSYYTYHTESRVVNFSEQFANILTNCSVLATASIAEGNLRTEMFKDGFSTVIPISGIDSNASTGDFLVTKKTGTDSTWIVTNTGDGWGKHNFKSTVRMYPDDDFGFHRWGCSGSGLYDEGNGYTATAETVTEVEYAWVKDSSATSINYNLTANGQIKCTTLYGSISLDYCNIFYKSTVLGSRYQRDFYHTLVHIGK